MIRIILVSSLVLVLSSFGEFDRHSDTLENVSTTQRIIGNMKFIEEEWIDISEDHSVHVIRQRNPDSDQYISVGGQLFYPYSKVVSEVSYNNGLLDVLFEDINDDGYLDLIISGIVNYQYKDNIEIESVLFIYLCNDSLEKFVLKFKKASFDLDVKNDAIIQWEIRKRKGVIAPR